ncbi:MAG: DUF3015 family protein [Nitrospinae bacterium]|nr:DUF3015 family protein [Nitrospinota bacterium]
MRKMLVVLSALVLTAGFAGTSHAAKYGAGGCGVGSIIFQGKNDKVSQVLAATTNGTLGNGTFGISTGTLNCDATGLVVASRETEVYAQNNFDSIAKEMASGSGEHVATLAVLMGYDSAALASYGKTHYGQIFVSENTTSSEMLTAIKVGLDS